MSESTRLWAPWRIGFLAGPKPDGCFMCTAMREPATGDRDTLVLERGEHSFVIMNRYPYTNGHLLIVPRSHTDDFAAMSDETASEIARFTRDWIRVLREVMKPDAFNVGWNLGVAAGAGVADHIHQHVVPRWVGDVNFMSACTDMRVVSQSLDEAWGLLSEARARQRT